VTAPDSPLPSVIPPAPAKRGAAKGFGGLARRITSRTTDLLAIAIVLIGGLAIGRQTLIWWRQEPPTIGAAPAADFASEWGRDGAPVALEFGDLRGRLLRQAIEGDVEDARHAGLEQCLQLVNRNGLPSAPVNAPEQRILELLASQKPVLEQAGDWRLYIVGGGLTMLVGVRNVPEEPATVGKSEDEWARERVVCWSFAVPVGQNLWSVYTYAAADAPDARPLCEAPLPRGAKRILSLDEADRGSLLAFEGEGPPDQWAREYQQWFESQGWTLVVPWQTGELWGATWRAPQQNVIVEVRFNRGNDRRWSGIVSAVVK
jgi:hypothetical protein